MRPGGDRRAQAPAGEAMATATLGLTFLMTGEPSAHASCSSRP